MSDKPLEQSIFLTALELATPAEREAYLRGACGDNEALRAAVAELLAAHERAGNILDAPPVAAGGTVAQDNAGAGSLEQSGTVIGPYKLLEQIGEGGMGTVWMAQQTAPVKRLVAVKLIKAGMDSRQVIARFEAERQALALMDHPNIARVLDGGTTSAGRPYFVMDLVKGVPITRYCDEHHLTPQQRLELFIPVCQAVQHAHQKGIIHRDLKPSNVLVAPYDGVPVVKVIDFGVAKAAGPQLTDRTLVTGFGAIVGTLEYMSPEQAELNNNDVDTRSDIYSLGVVLYELLTGSPPFTCKELGKDGMLEMLRVIREQEPSKPSTKLSTAEGLPTLAANRGTEPAKLTKLVRGELDWIVMKALEKDRGRRYETANGFAMDVQRYLADEAVLACPPSVGYRLRKFARRNKRPVLAAALVLLSLVVGIIGTTWSMIRATEAEAEALSQAEQTERALIGKEGALSAARASEQTARTNEAMAKKAQAEAVENLGDALEAVDRMLVRVGNDRLANVPQMEKVRRELVGDALTFYEKFLHKHNADPLIRERTAMVNLRLANLQRILGQRAEAEAYYRTGFAMLEELTAKSPLNPDIRKALIYSHGGFADCLLHLDKRTEAETQIRVAVELAEGLVKEFPQDPRYLNDLAIASNNLVRLIASDRPEEAEKILRRNLALTSDDFPLGRTHHHLGILALLQGQYVEAEQAFRRALELLEKVVRKNPADWNNQAFRAQSLNKLAESIAANGRLKEAEEVYARAVAVWDKLAADYPAMAAYRDQQPEAHFKHAGILDQLNLAAEATNGYRKLMDLAVKRATDFPDVPKHQQFAWNRCLSLGQLLLKAGDIEEARDVFTKAEPFLEKLDAEESARFKHWQNLCRIHTDIGLKLMTRGKKQEADGSCQKVVAILDKLETEYGAQDEYRGALARSNVNAGWLLHNTGKHLEAEKPARRALAYVRAVAAQRADGSELRPTLADGHNLLGNVLANTGRAQEAEVEFRKALPLYEQLAIEFPKAVGYRRNLAHFYNGLGSFLRNGAGGLPAAEKEHRRALALFEQLSIDFPADGRSQHDRAMLLETVAVLQRERGDLGGARTLLEQATIYAQKACDLDPKNQTFQERLRSSRAELAKTLKAHESEKKDMPK